MPYNVITKPTFMDDILDFDKSARKQLSQMYSDLAAHAEDPRDNIIKKLSGFKRLWRYRIADYRIIYAVNENVVQLLAARIRRDVYDRFDYDPDNVNEAATMALEATLFPNSSVAQELKSQKMGRNMLLNSKRNSRKKDANYNSSMNAYRVRLQQKC